MKSTTTIYDDVNYQTLPKDGETPNEVLSQYDWFKTYIEKMNMEFSVKK